MVSDGGGNGARSAGTRFSLYPPLVRTHRKCIGVNPLHKIHIGTVRCILRAVANGAALANYIARSCIFHPNQMMRRSRIDKCGPFSGGLGRSNGSQFNTGLCMNFIPGHRMAAIACVQGAARLGHPPLPAQKRKERAASVAAE